MRSTPANPAALLLAILVICGVAEASGPERQPTAIDPKRSIVAIVTERGGFAKRFAHDHLVAAPIDSATLWLDGDTPESSRFVVEADVEALLVDDAALRERWSPRLVELGLAEQGLEPLKAKDVRKVRAAMLGSGQLDATNHPTLRFEVVSIRRSATGSGGTPFDHAIDLDVTIRGETVRTTAVARLDSSGPCPIVEGTGDLTISSFSIQPYSAMLGAVRNLDRMRLYLNLAVDCGE